MLDADDITRAVRVPDLSLHDNAVDLELANQQWQTVMRDGYFGTGRPWER